MSSFFTSRTKEISTRLHVVATLFKLSGAAVIALALAASVVIPMLTDGSAGRPVRLYRWMFPVLLGLNLLRGASLILIGRALERRLRWGGYLAGITLGIPLVRQLMYPDLPALSVPGLAVTTAALVAIVTVWNELGTQRDAEFDEVMEERESALPVRNRGFGEPRALGEGPAAIEQRPVSLTPAETRNTL
ncbi:MAG: hypothetical protein ACO1Q7_10380 [Gemmatimonas sp.]